MYFYGRFHKHIHILFFFFALINSFIFEKFLIDLRSILGRMIQNLSIEYSPFILREVGHSRTEPISQTAGRFCYVRFSTSFSFFFLPLMAH